VQVRFRAENRELTKSSTAGRAETALGTVALPWHGTAAPGAANPNTEVGT
jgi:hypothetical protein